MGDSRRVRGRAQGEKESGREAGERENVCGSHWRLPTFWALAKCPQVSPFEPRFLRKDHGCCLSWDCRTPGLSPPRPRG